jgi:hypothetical protein
MAELVRITHPQLGEAYAPASALRQMPAWRLAEDAPPSPAKRPRKKETTDGSADASDQD